MGADVDEVGEVGGGGTDAPDEARHPSVDGFAFLVAGGRVDRRAHVAEFATEPAPDLGLALARHDPADVFGVPAAAVPVVESTGIVAVV